MRKLKTGEPAPLFSLLASHGKMVSLKDYLGKKIVVLYFYPKDDTPGCTVEACGFRDCIKDIEKFDTVVLGISPDGKESHQKFINKFRLSFLLLCDENKEVCSAYGVWVEKNMYGRKYMGVARTTFIINKSGVIAKIFERVKPQGHNQEVFKYIVGELLETTRK